MGASLRSIEGSPAWTAIVSGCGTGSAYLKAFKPQCLLRVTKVFQHRHSRRHFGAVARDQGSLATNAGRVGPGTRPIEPADRVLQADQDAVHAAQRSLGLALD